MITTGVRPSEESAANRLAQDKSRKRTHMTDDTFELNSEKAALYVLTETMAG